MKATVGRVVGSGLAIGLLVLLVGVTAQASPDRGSDEAPAPDQFGAMGFTDIVDEARLLAQARQAGVSTDGIRDLLAARQATAPFHSIDVAQTAGWPDDATGCLDFPDGYEHDPPGAMGHHWLNFDLYLDGGVLDPTRPEAVLYETQADGSLRMTAVEYVIPSEDLPPTADPPVLFGRELMFHEEFDAWALHVWLWRHNPYGLFADVNPRVGCEFAEAE